MSKRLSPIRRLERFLASQRGKRILNYFYSWGAAFVILGALFKLLHIRYGDEILLVSMLTEFAVFFISGFERPETGSKEAESSDKAYPSSAILHQQHQLAVTSTDLPEQGQGDTDTLTSNITELNAVYARQVKELSRRPSNGSAQTYNTCIPCTRLVLRIARPSANRMSASSASWSNSMQPMRACYRP